MVMMATIFCCCFLLRKHVRTVGILAYPRSVCNCSCRTLTLFTVFKGKVQGRVYVLCMSKPATKTMSLPPLLVFLFLFFVLVTVVGRLPRYRHRGKHLVIQCQQKRMLCSSLFQPCEDPEPPSPPPAPPTRQAGLPRRAA